MSVGIVKSRWTRAFARQRVRVALLFFFLSGLLGAPIRSARAGDDPADANEEKLRVGLVVHGSNEVMFRTEVKRALVAHHAEVVDSGDLKDQVAALADHDASTDDYGNIARSFDLSALVDATVTSKGGLWKMTLRVRDGADGSRLGEHSIQGNGQGPRALAARVRTGLWASLRPMLEKARRPTPRASPPPEEKATAEAPSPPAAETSEPTAKEEPAAKSPAPAVEKASEATPRRPIVWLSGSVIQDAAYLAGADDACTESSQANGGISCFRAQGTQYLGTPVTGSGDGFSSTVVVSTTRLVLGSDFRITPSATLGARVGAAFRGGGPTPSSGESFLPIHLEGRLAWWPGNGAYASRFAPFLFVAGGIAQVDGHIDVNVVENRKAPPPASQLDNPPKQTLTVWRKAGAGFAALGVGVFVPMGDTHGLLLDLKGMFLFPSLGAAAGLSLGYALGF